MQQNCAHNAISFMDYDRCGEPIQQCQCLKGFKGDGYARCDGLFLKNIYKKNKEKDFHRILLFRIQNR